MGVGNAKHLTLRSLRSSVITCKNNSQNKQCQISFVFCQTGYFDLSTPFPAARSTYSFIQSPHLYISVKEMQSHCDRIDRTNQGSRRGGDRCRNRAYEKDSSTTLFSCGLLLTLIASTRMPCSQTGNLKAQREFNSENTFNLLSHRSPFTLFNTGKVRSSTTL